MKQLELLAPARDAHIGIAAYEKYLELTPKAKDKGGVNFTIAALYQQAGNKAKAKEYYEKVTTDPQYGPSAQEQLKTL